MSGHEPAKPQQRSSFFQEFNFLSSDTLERTISAASAYANGLMHIIAGAYAQGNTHNGESSGARSRSNGDFIILSASCPTSFSKYTRKHGCELEKWRENFIFKLVRRISTYIFSTLFEMFYI